MYLFHLRFLSVNHNASLLISFSNSSLPPFPALLTYSLERPHSHWIFENLLLDRIVIFGHSFGGLTAQFLQSGSCLATPRSSPSPPGYICEGIRTIPASTQIVGLVLYEGYVFAMPGCKG